MTDPNLYYAYIPGAYPSLGTVSGDKTYFTTKTKKDVFIRMQFLKPQSFFIWSKKNNVWNEWF